MRNLIILTSVAIGLSGCNSLGILFGPKIEPASTNEQYVRVTPITTKKLAFNTKYVPDDFRNDCDPYPSELAPNNTLLAGELALAMGTAVFTIATDAINSKVDEINERASAVYSAQDNILTSELKKVKCISITRSVPAGKNNESSDTQLSILIALNKFGERYDSSGKITAPAIGFQIAPLYISSKKSLALTKCDNCPSTTQNREGKIAVSVAIAQSTITESQLKPLGKDVFTVSNINVGENQTKPSTMSLRDIFSSKGTLGKPIPYANDDQTVYLNFGVTETGTLAGKDAKAKAEIKALSEALGPAVTTLIDNHYK